jgi:hypothetical protein
MSIIEVTAFCSKVTCCPKISIDTVTAEVTITDDYNGTLVTNRGIFLCANFYARKLAEKKIDISVSATFREPDYTIEIINRDEVYYLALEYKGQKVKEITLEQWLILADAVYKSFEPTTFILDEELIEPTKTNLLLQAKLIASSLNKVGIDPDERALANT